jgi:hypothetical protein
MAVGAGRRSEDVIEVGITESQHAAGHRIQLAICEHAIFELGVIEVRSVVQIFSIKPPIAVVAQCSRRCCDAHHEMSDLGVACNE